MEQLAEEAFTDAVKQKILQALKIEPDDLEDLGGFESFVFHRRSSNTIIRMTHTSHRQAHEIQAEMEFIQYLSDKGAAVCDPVCFDDGDLVVRFDEFIVSQFKRALGHVARGSDLDWRGYR